MYLPGKDNKIADALSRLAKSGDYEIRQEVLEEALDHLQIRPTVDIFSNRRNRKCRRFYSLVPDPWALGQDGLTASWENEVPLLHPPIPLI
jgi:hypothetical protein